MIDQHVLGLLFGAFVGCRDFILGHHLNIRLALEVLRLVTLLVAVRGQKIGKQHQRELFRSVISLLMDLLRHASDLGDWP
jgi:hypothetical protein